VARVDEQRTMWSRARKVLREAGLRQLWFRTLGELGYRRQLVTELLLPVDGVGVHQPSNVEARFLEDTDLDAYATLHAAPDGATERFARGERCFGIWLDGRLVSTRWLATGTAHIGYLTREVALAPGEVYIYETYTEPGHRGRGISGVAGAIVSAALAAEGVRRIVGVLEPENEQGLRANKKAGYRIVGRIGHVKLGPFRREFGRL
jgi:GNAT superfamily N-acetyltransferase